MARPKGVKSRYNRHKPGMFLIPIPEQATLNQQNNVYAVRMLGYLYWKYNTNGINGLSPDALDSRCGIPRQFAITLAKMLSEYITIKYAGTGRKRPYLLLLTEAGMKIGPALVDIAKRSQRWKTGGKIIEPMLLELPNEG